MCTPRVVARIRATRWPTHPASDADSLVDSCAQESFPSSPRGDALLVPTNVLELWYRKFDDKFRRDPDFLLRAPPGPL